MLFLFQNIDHCPLRDVALQHCSAILDLTRQLTGFTYLVLLHWLSPPLLKEWINRLRPSWSEPFFRLLFLKSRALDDLAPGDVLRAQVGRGLFRTAAQARLQAQRYHLLLYLSLAHHRHKGRVCGLNHGFGRADGVEQHQPSDGSQIGDALLS